MNKKVDDQIPANEGGMMWEAEGMQENDNLLRRPRVKILSIENHDETAIINLYIFLVWFITFYNT